jgi:hypothetical protein
LGGGLIHVQVRFPIRRLFPEELLSPDISERLRGHCVVPHGISGTRVAECWS